MRLLLEDFLKEAKQRVKDKKLDFVPTRKNRRSRQKYGISILEIEDTILKLTPGDLYKGPEIDRDCPGEILWIFKRGTASCEDILFYIKLKFRERDKEEIVCISFHEDE